MDEQKGRKILARAIRYAMETRSMMMGAHLHAEETEDGRMTFSVERKADGDPGEGARAIGEFFEMTDAVGIDVFIDVRAGEPRLLRYYRDFGFRLVDGDHDTEEAEVRAIEVERAAWMAKGHDIEDMGVVTLYRNQWAGPLLAQIEIDEIHNGTIPRSAKEENAQQRDTILIALQKRGMTAQQAGYRVSPTLCAHEVCMRTSIRRKQGWNVLSFKKYPGQSRT